MCFRKLKRCPLEEKTKCRAADRSRVKPQLEACEQVCKEAFNRIQSKLDASLRKPLGLLCAEGRLEEGESIGAKINGVFLLAINCWRQAVYSAELLLRICSTFLHVIMGIFWQSRGLGYWPGCPCTAMLRLKKYEVLTGRRWSLNSTVVFKMLNFLFIHISKMKCRGKA